MGTPITTPASMIATLTVEELAALAAILAKPKEGNHA